MTNERRSHVISTPDEAVYATVSYADVFDLAIKVDQLQQHLIGASLTLLETSMLVDEMVNQGLLARDHDYVTLAGREELFDSQVDRTERATLQWQQAERWGERVGRIPFVRMVAVTGALARNSMASHDTIELFVVTRPRRLWTTRLMIGALCRRAASGGVKLRLDGLVSTRALDMRERSVHGACQLAQMAVLVGDDVCQSLRRSNEWMFEFLPNASIHGDQSRLCTLEPSSAQKWTESFLLLPPFKLFENWERKRQVNAVAGAQATPLDESQVSPDVCRLHADACAVVVDQAWKQRLADRPSP